MNVKVTPRLTQIWVNKKNHVEVELTDFYQNSIGWDSVDRSHSGNIFDNLIHERFTFKPANDLEWLAVNCIKWNDPNSVIEKINNDFGFSNEARLDGEYTKQQWHDMRVHLGLEESIDLSSKHDEVVEPVFTQAMADAGELPHVGELIQFRFKEDVNDPDSESFSDWYDGQVDYYGEVKCLITSSHEAEGCFWTEIVEFKPIDTRTDEEKLIDDITDVIHESRNLKLTPLDEAKHLLSKFNITPQGCQP